MKPILFSPEMVLALLNSEPGTWPPRAIDPAKPIKGVTRRLAKDPAKPPYKKGDVLWVREAWRTVAGFDTFKPSELKIGAPLYYEADGALGMARWDQAFGLAAPADWNDARGRYRNARFMCRWMARLWVEVVEDPQREALWGVKRAGELRFEGKPADGPDNWFVRGWDKMHPENRWRLNPLVWRIPIMRLDSPPA